MLLLLAALTVAPQAQAQTVFDGDPIDADSDRPHTILPGVALVLPGEDEKFDTRDDIIDTRIVGDVDLVLRTGNTFGGGAIPPPAAGVAAAPRTVAGGVHSGAGSEVPFQVIVSDGVTPPATGALLDAADMNARGVLVLAYGDLDGDGFIGPTNADGSGDNRLERQEIEVPVGRQVAAILGGVAAGSLGLSRAAPESTGGLGVVLVAGATTGPTPPLFEDGPWIATSLPFIPELDPERIIGRGNVLPPDPEGLVEVRLETEHFFIPAPNHPQLGTPFALPLDGSAATIDLARAVSAPARSVAFVRPADPATFVVSSTARLLPAVGPSGGRALATAVADVEIPDDGPGNAASVWLIAVDLFGNPADPGDGLSVVLETGSALRIVSPDADGVPDREVLTPASAAAVAVTVDDRGGAGDGADSDRIDVLLDGAIASSVRVSLRGASVVTATPPPTATPSPTGTTSSPTATASPLLSATPAVVASATATPVISLPCAGDCDSNAAVSVDELVRGVNIALDRSPLDACASLDTDASGTVAINELIAAVGNALRGCL